MNKSTKNKNTLSVGEKATLSRAVKKTVKDYGKTLKLLAKE
jgi:hypothetical protein